MRASSKFGPRPALGLQKKTRDAAPDSVDRQRPGVPEPEKQIFADVIYPIYWWSLGDF